MAGSLPQPVRFGGRLLSVGLLFLARTGSGGAMVTVQEDLQRPALLAVFVVESRSSHRHMKRNLRISWSTAQLQKELTFVEMDYNLRHWVYLRNLGP